MNQQLSEIRDQQKQSWNKFSPGWKKWDELTMELLKPMGLEIITAIKPSGEQKILDIAAGTGEPGLTIASMLDGGFVTITDLAEGMLEIAKENAQQRGIYNIETITCDVSELPFDDNSFDAVSCRMGFMFFPDMQLAASEMYRVLKPGGTIAASYWNGPDKNFWVTATLATINKIMDIAPPPPGSPGMFRCAQPGLIKEIFEKAGFKDTSEKEVTSKLDAGTKETYWSMMTEVAAPVVAALGKANEETTQRIKKEVFAKLDEKYPGHVAIEASANVISATKR